MRVQLKCSAFTRVKQAYLMSSNRAAVLNGEGYGDHLLVQSKPGSANLGNLYPPSTHPESSDEPGPEVGVRPPVEPLMERPEYVKLV